VSALRAQMPRNAFIGINERRVMGSTRAKGNSGSVCLRSELIFTGLQERMNCHPRAAVAAGPTARLKTALLNVFPVSRRLLTGSFRMASQLLATSGNTARSEVRCRTAPLRASRSVSIARSAPAGFMISLASAIGSTSRSFSAVPRHGIAVWRMSLRGVYWIVIPET